MPPPARDDARVDLAEASGAATIGDFKRSEAAAAQAVIKGRAQGTQLVVAQARSRQGWAMERLDNRTMLRPLSPKRNDCSPRRVTEWAPRAPFKPSTHAL